MNRPYGVGVLLGATDSLTRRPRRVLVAGTSGAGKTTLASRLGLLLGVPHVEIDGLYHGPNWTPRETFVADVEAFSSGPGWVTEWQYGAVRALLAERAELMVWLDFSRARVMSQVVARTVCRRLRRQELWNGNVEAPLHTFLTDPEHIVRWAWNTHAGHADRIAELSRQRPSLPVVRLRDRTELRHWVDDVLLPLVDGGPAGTS